MNTNTTFLRRLSRNARTLLRQVSAFRPAATSMPTLVMSGLATSVFAAAMALSHAATNSQAFI